MTTLQKDQILQYRGQALTDADGDKIGTIEEIYLDQETDAPEWALVKTGMFDSKSTFVPLRDVREIDGALHVAFDNATVKDAPKLDAGGALSQSDESELYRHYGMEYSELRSDSGLPEGDADDDLTRDRGGDVSGPETDDAMTRSEEELRVGTTKRETGRARLRKYVVTENVTQTVPVQREEVRIERKPITDANRDAATSGADISEEEHEVVLHEEQVVVDKNVVAKERVQLGKDTITEDRQVDETVRSEQVELIDADGESAEGVDGARGTDDGVTR